MSSKSLLENIFYKALKNIQANTIIQKNISLDKKYLYIANNPIKRNSFKKLYVFSVGKAAYAMAKEAENILQENIAGGLVVSLEDKKLSYVKTCQSSHPKVSKKSLQCADALLAEIKKVKKDDLFLFFLSGGASAMIEKPMASLTFEEFQKISDALLISGVDIKALNSVRKSISLIKGGKLAKDFKAKGFVLVLSDVIGDDLNTIGSALMQNEKFPHYVIGNNSIALEGAKKYIQSYVQKVKILTTTLDTTSKQAAHYTCKEIKKYDAKYESFCLLIGGETTLKVKGKGKGGRNSELALRLTECKSINKDIAILCAGSDGMDGNSDIAGAFVNVKTLQKIEQKKLDPKKYLLENDSATFFKKLGCEFQPGLTGTNVMDFVFILKLPQNKE
ncbi:glycerate kinase type-2 family protein [Sulfurimonas sp.]|uniref:glycerate kinase type-2 family protein n=1 Tax=Sulfurimonas sp. TaxID=2022749 RepID=UPI003D0A497D